MDAHADDHQTDSGSRVRVMDSRKILFDGEGFLNDFDDWSEAVFVILAGERGLTRITDQHWRVVRFLREYYAYHGRAPLNRQLREGTGLSVMEMEKLFPDGLKQGARRLSGLPNPKTCN
ncbi:MAG: TusE/DsrC/DsvC family sulfur relay protein [Pseudomonadota bacterium]